MEWEGREWNGMECKGKGKQGKEENFANEVFSVRMKGQISVQVKLYNFCC